jgi:hypothetical protein
MRAPTSIIGIYPYKFNKKRNGIMSIIIDEFVDVETTVENDTVTPGGLFTVHGHKIKAAGSDPAVGVYFVDAADPSKEVKVDSKHLAENTASKIIGAVPTLTTGKRAGKGKDAIRLRRRAAQRGESHPKPFRVKRDLMKPTQA